MHYRVYKQQYNCTVLMFLFLSVSKQSSTGQIKMKEE